MKHIGIPDALQSLRPGAEWVVRGEEIEWLDAKQSQPTDEEVQAEIVRLQALQPSIEAKANRKAAYTAEADPIFFKFQRGEATQEEWLAKIAEIKAMGSRALRGFPVEDTAVAVIRFASGALGVIQATTSVHPGYPKTIAVHGDKGSAVIEQEDVLRWDFTPPTPEDAQVKARFAQKVGASGGSADPKAISHEGHRRQLADFVDAIRDNRAPKVDGREGKKAVDLICAIYESARTGRTITL